MTYKYTSIYLNIYIYVLFGFRKVTILFYVPSRMLQLRAEQWNLPWSHGRQE